MAERKRLVLDAKILIRACLGVRVHALINAAKAIETSRFQLRVGLQDPLVAACAGHQPDEGAH